MKSYYEKENNWKKILGIALIVVGTLIIANQILCNVVAKYNYEKSYSNLWELADKSSTIPAKEKYILAFVNALKSGKAIGDFSEYDAIWLKTPNNNFDANLAAVETLAQRLKEIQEMSPKTFEYNTAIQQITDQEQDQAHQLMGVLNGCYVLKKYWIAWSWIDGILVSAAIMMASIGVGFLLVYYDF